MFKSSEKQGIQLKLDQVARWGEGKVRVARLASGSSSLDYAPTCRWRDNTTGEGSATRFRGP